MKRVYTLLVLLIGLPKIALAKDEIGKNFFQMRPLQFLTYIKEHCCDPVVIVNAPADWITKDDVVALSKYIESEEKAAPVVSLLSSSIPPDASTVGIEARFLIRGYHEQRYPPALHSGPTATKSAFRVK